MLLWSIWSDRLETVIQTEVDGIGYALLLKHGDQRKLLEWGSRLLADAESRYAVANLELRGVEWLMKKFSLYLFGLPKFKSIVDHQPLVTILNLSTLDAIENPRL